MSKFNRHDPAFPLPATIRGDSAYVQTPSPPKPEHRGLTKREHFIGQALNGWWANPSESLVEMESIIGNVDKLCDQLEQQS